MTGAPGGYGVPADTGVHGSFLEHVSYFGLFGTQRWTIFLTLGILAWLLTSLVSAALVNPSAATRTQSPCCPHS